MLTYNVPVAMMNSYSNGELIVRSRHPRELVEAVCQVDENRLFRVDLVELTEDAGALTDLPASLPVGIVMGDKFEDLGALYAFQDLAANRPVIMELSVTPGFNKAVKAAVSLGFGVRLQGGQPDESLVEELKSALEFYLHHTMVDQPIEFFHGLLIAFYDESPRTMWHIQFEDPSVDRYVTDEGALVLSDRLRSMPMPDGECTFLDDLKLELLTERGECSTCPFFVNCAGYFKVPERSYSCKHVKELLGMIKDAAKQLRIEFGEGQT